jgi:phytoene desaturase
MNSALPAADDKRPHALVIGAGFGGLAAAIRLGARGYRVTVIDRLDQPGGRARKFEQDGFTFDAGPTIVTAPFLFEELFALCGERMEDHVTLKSLSPFYTVRFDDGSELPYSEDTDAMRREIAKFNPDDVDGYDRLLVESEKCYQTGFVKMVDRPFHKLSSMVGAIPDLLSRRAERSIYKMVSRYIKDERLRQAFSFHPLFIGGNPMRASSVFGLILHLEKEAGVHYAMGGTNTIAVALANLIKGQGGTIRYESEAAEIHTEGNRATGVRLTTGEVLSADVVVSNADAAWTHSKLLPKGRAWSEAKLAKAAYSMGLFVWYFGTKKRYEDVGHHTIMMGPRYRELLKDIFDRKILADDFSLYLHRPTATDPSMAPDGCDGFYVLSPVPNLSGNVDWSTAAEPYRQKIEAHLEATMLPGLRENIVTSRLLTPPDFETDYLSYYGAGFSFEPKLTQIAWFRPHNQNEDLTNLYLVGAGTHPGAGVPGVIVSAKIIDKLVPAAKTLV